MKEKVESRITSIGTAIPKYHYQQSDLASWMHQRLEPENERLGRLFKVLYKKTKIGRRHSVLKDFQTDFDSPELFKSRLQEPRVEDRLSIYDRESLTLAEEAAKNCLKQFPTEQITHLITVSCTGMSAPGLEIQLKQKLNLKHNVQSHAVNFVGCYAFFPALKMADAFCKANSNSKVLIVCVELCTLHFQNKKTDDHILSNALFSDGAAAALISAKPSEEPFVLKLKQFEQLLIPKGKSDMAWNIHSEGFLMKLSSYVPALVDEGIPTLIKAILKSQSILKEEILHWAIHPGGRKILEVCETELQLKKSALHSSYNVLQKFGNMSAPTILFVLKDLMENDCPKSGEKLFACGFGPGLTLEAALFEIE